MKREYIFLSLIALFGYTGGTTTQQWLAHDGSITEPAYSFSAEPGLGVYRAGPGQICTTGVDANDGRVCFQNGQMQIGAGNVSGARLQFDQSPTGTGLYFADTTTDTIGWFTDTSTGDLLIGTYGTRFGVAGSIGTTHLHTFGVSSGNLSMQNSAGSSWTGAMGLGYTNYPVRLDVGNFLAVGTNGATAVTGMRSGGADAIEYVVNSTSLGYSRGLDLLEITGANVSMLVSPANASPAAGDCDAAAEDGRLHMDYSNNRLYVCNATSTNNWMYVDLTE